MKLRVRFLQLPIRFDAERLAAEVAALPADAWRPHPQRFAGNDAAPLITTDGDLSSDARTGAMRPTPHLLACPYLMQALATLGATWGRARLMRLSGAAEVSAHVDTDYYWRDHMRLHVPILTQPSVRFVCGGEEVHMAAGEAWLFDTWSLHSVHNDAAAARIHLVADTVGGEGLLALMEAGRSPKDSRPGWTPRLVAPSVSAEPALAYESVNAPEVMTPWELRDHLGFLLAEARPGDPRFPAVAQALNRLRVGWHALWAQSGPAQAARPAYAALLADAWRRLEAAGVHEIALVNGMPLGRCLQALIFNAALAGAGAVMDGDTRGAPALAKGNHASPEHPGEGRGSSRGGQPHRAAYFGSGLRLDERVGRDPLFDRPVFIVSPPRSGSTLLFETLAASPDLCTIGGESHALMESVAEIGPAAHGWASNRLTAADAPPAATALLRERFRAALKDRDGRPPPPGPARMLEKTPKNALRIPFLAAAFPEARFVYLHRDARATMASMIEAWASGAFRTYPELPGWRGPPWSLLLTPGWRDLAGAGLPQIVAAQWATTTRILLDDLAALAPERWLALDYDAFVAAPGAQVARLAGALGVRLDRPVGPRLRPSRFTLTPASPDKWRRHEAALEATRGAWAREAERARTALEARRTAA